MSATSLPQTVCDTARVLSNERLPAGSHHLRLQLEGATTDAGPGQFVMLSLDGPGFPLLPRPFSLLGWERDGDGVTVEFLIMPVGRVSRGLCDLEPGDGLHMVGPFGHRLDESLPAGELACVAGGYGVAPFVFLCERLAAATPPRVADVTVIYGAREAGKLALVERLEATGAQVVLTTDDGSRGRPGRVDAALAERLEQSPCALVLTCGPDPMMEAVGSVGESAGVPTRASLETVMGCGYAVCNGCAVGVDDASDPQGHTYQLACREGTLFDTDQLQWALL
jgi:dihydroorotate dehydrogenase electron transfer subunit